MTKFLFHFIAMLTFLACSKKQAAQPVAKPVASFDFTVSNLELLPVQVSCTNTSTCSNLNYNWSFGDNNTSTQANASDNYTSGGIYNITLTVTNSAGSSTVSKQLRICPYPQVYIDFNGDTLNLFAWEGKKVVVLSRNNNLDRAPMFAWAKTMDLVYGYYRQCTGQDPAIGSYIDNLSTIADVPSTCGAGCSYIGATGIEIQNTYFDIMYNAINVSDQYDQVNFYEFGRNFWFYSSQLQYKNNDPVVTGFAVFMRFMSMAATGVNGAPFGSWSFDTFRANEEGLIDTYLADTTLNWANTLGAGNGVPNSGLGATDLFASFCFRLRRDYGGESFVQNVWKQAGLRPAATTTQDAVDNFFLASCAAANKNLSSVFKAWRWPVAASAVKAAAQYP